MTTQQVPVQLSRLGPQPRTFLDPVGGVLAEKDMPGVRVDPVTLDDLGFVSVSQRSALLLESNVRGAGRSIPSGPLYRACQRPEGSSRTRPNRRCPASGHPPAGRCRRRDTSGLDELG